MGAIVIISTYPDRKSILKTSNLMVEKHLAACVNFIKIDSVYAWQGKIEKTVEFLAFFKTTSKTSSSLKRELKKLHPYKIPEIVEIKISSTNKSYLDWLVQSTQRYKS